ncbi:GNAT family N-acetyltransferase [Trueperella pyogenes]|uniref:GNAT family N-acetyltransferase n=1 Tax=Trueperella pyogenes TaxID=1661 RepID=UPI00345DF238
MKIWITLKNAILAAYHPNSRIRIGAIRTPHDYQAAIGMLAEHIEQFSQLPFPVFPIHDQAGLYGELIGAWHNQGLVGALMVGPAHHYTHDPSLLANPAYKPEVFTAAIACIDALVVKPGYRRHGIGLALKNTATAWADQHGASIMLSVPTTNAARELTKKAGYQVLGPNIILMIKHPDHELRIGFPFPNDTVAVYAFNNTTGPAINVSYQHLPTLNSR